MNANNQPWKIVKSYGNPTTIFPWQHSNVKIGINFQPRWIFQKFSREIFRRFHGQTCFLSGRIKILRILSRKYFIKLVKNLMKRKLFLNIPRGIETISIISVLLHDESIKFLLCTSQSNEAIENILNCCSCWRKCLYKMFLFMAMIKRLGKKFLVRLMEIHCLTFCFLIQGWYQRL